MNVSVNAVDYLKAFLGGVGISLTPCVYPLIPVTLGVIGARANGSKLKGFILSLIFVTGVAITYSILGLIASFTGRAFGSISSNPFTFIFVGIVVILFGLSMLDLFPIPSVDIVKLPAFRKQNYLSVFLLGISSGFIVSPCLTPVLGSILVILVTKKNLFYGTTLLFSFAYGMGFILLLAGTFSSLLMNIPKLGKFMLYVKKFFSLILISVGIFFLYNGLRRL